MLARIRTASIYLFIYLFYLFIYIYLFISYLLFIYLLFIIYLFIYLLFIIIYYLLFIIYYLLFIYLFIIFSAQGTHILPRAVSIKKEMKHVWKGHGADSEIGNVSARQAALNRWKATG